MRHSSLLPYFTATLVWFSGSVINSELSFNFMVAGAMAGKSVDYDPYVECDETSLASLISPGGADISISAVIGSLASSDESLEKLREVLKTCEGQVSESGITRSFVTDLAFEFSSVSWKLEEKAQLAWNLSVIKLALAKRAIAEGSSELAWEALACARYYSGYYEAAMFTTESPPAKRSAKGGNKKAEKKDEETALLSSLVKIQLVKGKPVRGWPNQAETVEKIAGDIVLWIEEFGFPLPNEFDVLCDTLNKLFEEHESIRSLYLENRYKGR